MSSQPSQITAWLAAWGQGDAAAADRLAEALYPELQRIAAAFVAHERQGHTLEPQGLIHEAWMRLASGQPVPYQDRGHFLTLAAKTMRRVLIDHARNKHREKRGGNQVPVSLSAVDGWAPVALNSDLLDLDRALDALARADARAAKVVELRFFGGLQESEVAEILGVSTVTVKRDWTVARAWLLHRIQPTGEA